MHCTSIYSTTAYADDMISFTLLHNDINFLSHGKCINCFDWSEWKGLPVTHILDERTEDIYLTQISFYFLGNNKASLAKWYVTQTKTFSP